MKAAPGLLALALAGSLASRSQADEADDSSFQASLSCRPVSGPGRILCELSTRATQGKLVWSDALVVQAPAFARPLKSRWVAQLGSPAVSGGAWAKLALVATGLGAGKLSILARGVVCYDGPAGESCAPVLAPVTVEILVGSPPGDASGS